MSVRVAQIWIECGYLIRDALCIPKSISDAVPLTCNDIVICIKLMVRQSLELPNVKYTSRLHEWIIRRQLYFGLMGCMSYEIQHKKLSCMAFQNIPRYTQSPDQLSVESVTQASNSKSGLTESLPPTHCSCEISWINKIHQRGQYQILIYGH